MHLTGNLGYAACYLMVSVVYGAPDNSDESVSISSSTYQMSKFTSRVTVKANCACVPIHQCLANGTFDKHGTNLLTYKLGLPKGILKLENPCPGEFDRWCCDWVPPGLDGTTKPSKPSDEPTTPKPREPTSKRPLVIPQPPKGSSTAGCGLRKNGLKFEYKIWGHNNEAQPNEFPWMAMVLMKGVNDQSPLRYQCAGSLIHERVVLTAAHCAAKINLHNAVIRAGERDVRVHEEYPYQDLNVSKIITHPAYDEDNLKNDISLIVTADAFKFTPNVNIICLPNEDEVIVDSNCMASGWGKNNTGVKQSVLQKISLPIVRREECESKLRETEELGTDFNLHESFICAGGIKGEDTCKGDGGGPLICPIKGMNDRYQQAGIVAWGIGCGNALPAVYVNVAHFKNWIDGEMKTLGLTTNYTSNDSKPAQDQHNLTEVKGFQYKVSKK